MPNMGGMEAIRRMKGHCPKAVVLVLTAHEDEGLMLEALRAGAAGYVLKVDSFKDSTSGAPGTAPGPFFRCDNRNERALEVGHRPDHIG